MTFALETSFSQVSIALISVAVVFIFVVITKMNSFPAEKTRTAKDTSICSSPNCVRCTQRVLQDSGALCRKLEEFVSRKKYNNSTVNRLIGATIGDSSNVLQDCHQKPTVLTVSGLKSRPWFDNIEQIYGETLSTFAEIKNQRIILQEFFNVFKKLHEGWNKNCTPSGNWFIFHLYNQGVKVESNCRKCPQTVALLDSVSSFMKDCAFGNALFSVLFPGTHITPHYGPTNCRLRCHVPLMVPPACGIVVNGSERPWKVAQLMVFDDSFLHEAWHRGEERTGPRIVLMFDLWHPELTPEEREAIAYLFPPAD